MNECDNIIRKIIRYSFMFLLTWIGVLYISANKLSTTDIIILALFIMCCFIFIDMYYPIVRYP